ncbi:restriction endonuclease subunit S [Anaerocolumna sp. MB42-C2]|uniref:restriction endonuclease subunit S n=1 Tax=Anaerocolumna sp. MB42-C2 TaxID=3070997 RepID=UPI0027E0BA6E|nr:restriction endonuclease subunit S [Anaerocolumna sp. MB42-C2]WMJ89454.1 restriction endonuclease subunit S [Anaerocolumna sp. MB42-C2]
MVVGWSEKIFGDLFNFSGGLSASRADLSVRGYPYLHYGDIHGSTKTFVDVCIDSNIPCLDININKVSNTSLLNDGDVVFVDASEDDDGASRHVVIRNKDGVPFISGLHTIVAKAKTDELDNKFREFCFQTNHIKSQFKFYSVGTKVTGISKANIAKIALVFPTDIKEQRRIAKALSDTDELISALEKLISKKRAIKQGTMQELLTGKHRLDGFKDEWVENTLESLCYLITKQTGFDYTATIKPSLINEFRYGYIPFIQNKDFEGEKINFKTDFYVPMEIATQFSKILLNEPCLLVSISGRIGNVAYFNGSDIAFVGGAVGVAKFHMSKMAKWVMLYLQSPIGQRMIFANEKAGAQHNLTIEDMRNFIIPCPTLEEQTAIASILSDMDAEIDALKTKLDKLRNIKKGMMSELLTGRIRLLEEV